MLKIRYYGNIPELNIISSYSLQPSSLLHLEVFYLILRSHNIKPCLARYGTARLKLTCEQAQNRTVLYRASMVIATVLHGTVQHGSITFAPCERITILNMHIIN